MKKIISAIKTEGKTLSEKTDEELSLEIEKIKRRGKKESLDAILIEWFSLVQ